MAAARDLRLLDRLLYLALPHVHFDSTGYRWKGQSGFVDRLALVFIGERGRWFNALSVAISERDLGDGIGTTRGTARASLARLAKLGWLRRVCPLCNSHEYLKYHARDSRQRVPSTSTWFCHN